MQLSKVKDLGGDHSENMAQMEYVQNGVFIIVFLPEDNYHVFITSE